jgi:hypothetical protein
MTGRTPLVSTHRWSRLWAAVGSAVLCLALGCGPVAAPPAAKSTVPPPPPPPAEPEPEPPAPPELPAELVANVDELVRLVGESKSQVVDASDLDGLVEQAERLAASQARMSTLAQQIVQAQAELSAEQRTEFDRRYLTGALGPLLGSSAPAVAPAANDR